MSFSLPQEQLQEIARVGRVGEDPREDVDVGVVECGLGRAGQIDLRRSRLMASYTYRNRVNAVSQ